MKPYIFIFTLIGFLMNVKSFSQGFDFCTNFDVVDYETRLRINSYEENIWQIGKPNKQTFSESHSFPNALVTDTINTYPINNISTFEITQYKHQQNALLLYFAYSIDTDSLNDYGYIEYAVDDGPWMNLTEQLYDGGLLPSPIFTGRRVVSNIDLYVNNLIEPFSYDSVTYRFVFVSDSIETNQDGWLIDDLCTTDFTSPVSSTKEKDKFWIYPNPTTNLIYLQQGKDVNFSYFYLYSLDGRLFMEKEIENINSEIDVSQIPSGIYFYKLYSKTTETFNTGKLIIQ